MNAKPIRKRHYHSFLSHAHVDKGAVDQIAHWLNDLARLRVWYDSNDLPAGATIVQALPEAIEDCRTLILVLSKISVTKGWVEEEYNAAVAQRAASREFRILPIVIEECEVPTFLRTTKWIDMKEGKLDLRVADELLSGLLYDASLSKYDDRKDLYISRGWNPNEAPLANTVCEMLDQAGFRLLADADDQLNYDPLRVRKIMSECVGMVAIAPERGGGKTSSYILNEIDIARQLNLPVLIVAEPSVNLPSELAASAIGLASASLEDDRALDELRGRVEELAIEWQQTKHLPYIFYATDFEAGHLTRNTITQRILQRATAMPCVMGENIRGESIQKQIRDTIKGASLVIADISEDNINTQIEAGVALGAGVELYLIKSGPRKSPEFMLRDQEVWFYNDDVELLGVLHQLAFDHRRQVLNLKLGAA